MLNTLYINSPNRYLALDGETVAVKENNGIMGRIPLHNLEGIVTCGRTGVSPALMGECAKRGISIYFMDSHGNFLAETVGEVRGNVLLRKEQYRISDNEERSLKIAKSFVVGKIYNSRAVLKRFIRDYSNRVDTENFLTASESLKTNIDYIYDCTSNNELIGWEGKCATIYFNLFDSMILQQKDDFFFKDRNRRPPRDKVNALLSFAYSLFGKMCSSALQQVGLDSYVGFLHKDRPGRASLSLDLLEEFRAPFCDRFVLSIINKRIIDNKHFKEHENGAVYLTDEGRKIFFEQWQEKKSVQIKHPFLKENVEWGMLPYTQALLLSRYIRGDLDAYPPFFWK